MKNLPSESTQNPADKKSESSKCTQNAQKDKRRDGGTKDERRCREKM